MAKSTKSTKKTTTRVKKEILAKQFGRNIIMTIEGQKYSKAFKVKEERDEVLEKVKAYNKRNSKAKEAELIELMLKGKTTEKERKEIVKKAVTKKAVKPKTVTKKADTMSIAAAKKLLEKDGYTVTKKRKSGHTGRRREY